MQYNSRFVDSFMELGGLLSIVNILCYINLILTMLNNIKKPLMEAYQCNITVCLSISHGIRRSIVDC